MSDVLDNEFQFFLNNRKELVRLHRGKFIVIHNQEVHGAFRSQLDAIQAAMKKFKLGTFIVQECSDSEGSFIRTFRTRANFAHS
jgi:hypothetical protein